MAVGSIVEKIKSRLKMVKVTTMRQFHEDAIAFLRTPHALKVLWPHLSPKQGEETIERLLAEFEE